MADEVNGLVLVETVDRFLRGTYDVGHAELSDQAAFPDAAAAFLNAAAVAIAGKNTKIVRQVAASLKERLLTTARAELALLPTAASGDGKLAPTPKLAKAANAPSLEIAIPSRTQNHCSTGSNREIHP